MAYYKRIDKPEKVTLDHDQPTAEDFDRIASPQDKKLWNEVLKDHPDHFERSIMPGMDHFLYLCRKANLVVELEKFHHYSDASGKVGDALRNMGLKTIKFTYREVDADLTGVAFSINKTIERELNHKSLVDIPHHDNLPLDDDDDITPHHGYKITVSGDEKMDGYKRDTSRKEPEKSVATYGGNTGILRSIGDEGLGGTYGGNAVITEHLNVGDDVPTYAGNAGITDSLCSDEDHVTTYGGNARILKNDDTKATDGYSYERFNGHDIPDIPLKGNWQAIKAEKSAEKAAEKAGDSGELKAEASGANVPKASADDDKPETAKPAEPETPIEKAIDHAEQVKAAKAAIDAAKGRKPEKVAKTEEKSEKPAEPLKPEETPADKPETNAHKKAQAQTDALVKKVEEKIRKDYNDRKQKHTKAAQAALAAAVESLKPREVKNAKAENMTDQPKNQKHIFIAKGATIVGDVRVGDDSSIWYGAVLRGDQAPITVGKRTNVQDGCVVHVDVRTPTIIGDGVTIGHNCTIHGCDIDDNVLIGMGTTILNRAKIAKNCIVGAGSLVTQDKTFPEGSLILGSPAKVVRKLTDEEIQGIRDNAEEYIELMDLEAGQPFEEIPGGFVKTIDD